MLEGPDAYLGPEAKARVEIDRQLTAAGWVVQRFKDMNLGAGPGVAVREFSMAIVEDLQAALAQFAEIASSLGVEVE